jgi:hypothetical protein
MSIHGKKEGFLRIFGSFLILLSIFLSVLFIILAQNTLQFYCLLIILFFPFALSVLLKLERDFFVKNSNVFLLLISAVIILINIIIFFTLNSLLIIFALLECSNILLICCWHFSLSLYKKGKIIFVLSGLGSYILNIILWLYLEEIIVILAFITPTLILGLFLIIFSELLMRKKGLLNYI